MIKDKKNPVIKTKKPKMLEKKVEKKAISEGVILQTNLLAFLLF